MDMAVPETLQVSVAGNAFAVGASDLAAYLNIDPVNTGALCAKTLIALLEGDAQGTFSKRYRLSRHEAVSTRRHRDKR
jgi:hypothetical protein